MAGFSPLKICTSVGTGFIHRVPGEAMDRQPRAMAHQAAQRDFLLSGEFIFRDLPTPELFIHVFIQ